MSDEIVIKVEHVSKNFVLPHDRVNSIKSLFTGAIKRKHKKTKETQHALRDISFEIKKGEFFGIVGRNGSGKSTMLKILANIYQPTEGSVVTKGKLVPFIELGVGFNAELTGRENVYLNGAMLGFARKEIDAMYDDIVAFAELERFMDQKLKNYSSGMQVRLAFSMATRADAEILLVDEVLAVGDADFQRKCYDYFRRLKKNKKTVIFVTHDMNAVREYCDRGILIEDSHLVKRGSADEIASEYTKMFIESAHNTSEKGNKTNRWGDGAITFKKVVTPAKLTDDDKVLSIKMWATANEDIPDPIFGFVIKNAAGAGLVGTNTLIEQRKIGPMSKGQQIYLKWTVPNMFGDGVHHLVLAAVYKSGSAVGDWWEDAQIMTVFRKQRAPYLIKPDIELEITDEAHL